MTPLAHSDETAFVRAVHVRPLDPLPRLIFADWLDEHGRVAEAAWLRADIRAAATHPDADPDDLQMIRTPWGPDGVPSLWLAKSVWEVLWAAAALFLSIGQPFAAALRSLAGRGRSGEPAIDP
jgi:uncharacterized protein (TIGR02996 family)